MTPRLSLLWRMPNQKKTSKTPLYHYLSNDLILKLVRDGVRAQVNVNSSFAEHLQGILELSGKELPLVLLASLSK